MGLEPRVSLRQVSGLAPSPHNARGISGSYLADFVCCVGGPPSCNGRSATWQKKPAQGLIRVFFPSLYHPGSVSRDMVQLAGQELDAAKLVPVHESGIDSDFEREVKENLFIRGVSEYNRSLKPMDVVNELIANPEQIPVHLRSQVAARIEPSVREDKLWRNNVALKIEIKAKVRLRQYREEFFGRS